MPDIYLDVDAALTAVPVNVFPLTDDTDFKTRETAVAYNAAGMDLVWNFVTSAGAFTQTAVTPTTAGTYDWTHQGDGMYTIEIPASGGASINNDTEGYGWFTGVATGVLPWRGPVVGFRHSSINDSLCDTNTTGLLAPTTAGRTLDVASTGEAGFDLANVNVPNGAIPFLGIVDNGTAQSATATTLVARAAAPDGSIQPGMTLMAYGSTQGYWQSVLIDSVSADTYTIAAWPLATPSGTITYYVQGTPAGSPNLLPDVNVAQISGDAAAANNCESFFDGTGYAGTGNTIPTVTTVNGLAANVVTASALATDAVSEIQSGLALAADLATVAGYLDTEIAAILADTNELQTDWANGGRLDLILDARASQTSVDDIPTVAEFEVRTPTAAQLAYIVANAATGLPVTFTTSGGSTTAAVLALVDGGSPSATNDQYNGRLLVFTDGTLKGVVTDITDYVGGTTTATITAIPTAPTSSHNARLI